MKHRVPVSNQKFLDTRRFSKKPHFDVHQVAADFNSMHFSTLRLLCEHLDIPSPKEGEVKAENVAEVYHAGGIQKIADYCEKDLVTTYRAYKTIRNYTYMPPPRRY